MGWPALQPKASRDSGMLLTLPMTRKAPGECGSVWASCRAAASVTFWHQTYGEAEEEALLGGEAVDLRARLAGERLLETDGDR
jgi:hypothetical protein